MLSQVIVRVRPLNDRETFLGKQSLTKVPMATSYMSSTSQKCVACTVDHTPVTCHCYRRRHVHSAGSLQHHKSAERA